MPLKKRGAALTAAAAALAIAIAGCQHQQAGTNTGSTDTEASVAVVNGQPIAQSDFFNQLQIFQPPQQQQQQAPEPVGRTVLRNLIETDLIEQLAAKENAAPTDQELDGVLAGEKALLDFQTIAGFEKQLQDAGLTEDDVKNRQLRPMLSRVKLLSNGTTVSDQDITQYYDKNKAQRFSLPDRVHIRKIALASQMEAQTIAAAIKGGKPFENYLGQSIDQSTPGGDVRQWIPLSGNIAPATKPIVDALKNVNTGDIAAPLNYGGSWWIVQVVDKKPASVIPLDQIRDLVRFQILSDKVQSNFSSNMDLEQKMRQFTASSNITTTLPLYQSLIDQIKNPPPPPSIPQMAPPSQPSAPVGNRPGPGPVSGAKTP